MADVYLPIGIEAVQAYIDTGTVTPDGKVIVAPLMATSGGGGGGGGGGATEITVSAINDKLPSLTGNGYLGVELTGNQLALESGGTLSAIDGKLPSSLGAKTAANSFPVTLSTDGVASGISSQIGEVQASPTANTIMDRLKAINTALTTGGIITVSQKSSAFRSVASLSRANNTTTYAANDVIFGAFELTSIANTDGFIYLSDVRFLMNISYLPPGIGNLRLFLYSVTPPSAIADNAAFSLPSGDRASCLTPMGISLGIPSSALGGGSLVASRHNINQMFKVTGTSLFGYLVTEGAWVPMNPSETATLTVLAVEV